MSIWKNCCDFRQRAAILVDNIFNQKGKKTSTQENIEKLIFYAISSPEKLYRISARLYMHLIIFCKSNRNDMVTLVFDVMNQLLDQSSASFKNLMMDDYFKMLLKLLSSGNPDFQILASKSFRKFANINVETPTFFEYLQALVTQFVLLCTSKTSNPESSNILRLAGLAGIQALILKTKNSTTQNIWNSEYADMIIPALFENLHTKLENESCPLDDDILPFFNEYIYVNKHGVIQTEINSQALSSLMSPFSSTPLYVALSNIRELLQSSTMANTSNIVLPIYQYWCKNNFWSFVNSTARLIELISQSLKPQLEHIPIKLLFEQIKKQIEDPNVICLIQSLPSFGSGHTGASLGHIYFEILSLLLPLLKESCSQPKTVDGYVNSLVSTIEILVTSLPYFQKSQVYQKIFTQLPNMREKSTNDLTDLEIIFDEIQSKEALLMLSCFEKISLIYDPPKIQSVLNLMFLEQLADCIRIKNLDIKILIIKIFINLIDQHKNINILRKYINDGNLDELSIPDNDLGDISIKKLVKVAEILCKGVFYSETNMKLAMELVIFICLLALEVNINEIHESICVLLSMINIESDVAARNLHQSTSYLIIYFIASLSKNQNLIELCSTVKSEAKDANLNTWAPFSSPESTRSSENHPPNYSESFFGTEAIKNAFISSESDVEEFSKSDDKRSSVLSEYDSVSIESLNSETKEGNTSACVVKPVLGSFGFIQRDVNEDFNLTLEDIKEKYIANIPLKTTVVQKIGEKSDDLEYYT